MRERWLSVQEIAARLGINRDTIYKWIADTTKRISLSEADSKPTRFLVSNSCGLWLVTAGRPVSQDMHSRLPKNTRAASILVINDRPPVERVYQANAFQALLRLRCDAGSVPRPDVRVGNVGMIAPACDDQVSGLVSQCACELLLDYEDEESEEDDGPPSLGGSGATSKARKRNKTRRYRWPDEVRDEVLASLLKLNAERAEQGRIAPRSAVAASGSTKRPHGKRPVRSWAQQDPLPQMELS